MQSGRISYLAISYLAMAAAAALCLASPIQIGPAVADDPKPEAMPGPVNLNWPPKAPELAPEAAPASTTTAAPAQAAPAPTVSAPTVSAPTVTATPVAPAVPSAAAAPAPVAPTAPPAAAVAAPQAAPQAPVPTPVVEAPAPAPAPKFALAAEISERLKREKLTGPDRSDRDAAVKVYDARQGVPVWVLETGYTPQAQALMTEIKAADSYGLQASAFKLPPAKLTATPTIAELADAEATLSLAALRYARHARGGRTIPAELSANFDRKPTLIDPAKVLTDLASAPKPDETLRKLHPQHAQFEKLRLKYVAVRSGQKVIPDPPAPAQPAPPAPGKKAAAPPKPVAPPTAAQIEKRLLANLEMWRWMPDMGDTHIQNNIPEFTTRLTRGGKIVHAERIVVGKTETQTPLFSNEMALVVFRPFWNVPESIKAKELQPQLMRSTGALAKAGLKAAYNGKEVDPGSVDWRQTDLRAFHVFQPPGDGNALGRVKFLFPNKHDVYMHDTPHKTLFNNPSRAYSHGCMRVRDPMKFAEVLLGHDKGWDRAKLEQLAATGPDNNEVRLTKKVPIHVTYFTATVEDDGQLKLHKDIYDHEMKVNLGLEGKAHLIPKPAPEVKDPDAPRLARAPVIRSQSSASSAPTVENWIKSIFNF